MKINTVRKYINVTANLSFSRLVFLNRKYKNGSTKKEATQPLNPDVIDKVKIQIKE